MQEYGIATQQDLQRVIINASYEITLTELSSKSKPMDVVSSTDRTLLQLNM
jgi:hypothetical protein